MKMRKIHKKTICGEIRDVHGTCGGPVVSERRTQEQSFWLQMREL